jgi:hypothetical protein
MRLVSALVVVSFSLPAGAQTLLKSYTGSGGWKLGAALHLTADQNSDGYPDVLVGAPGTNSGSGAIRCLSGRYLATSTGPAELWSLTPSMPNAAGFGTSIIEVATLTGNSATDFLIGAPEYKAGLFATGALILVDGATHTVAWTMVGYPNTRAGASLAAVGDQDGDGTIDVATTAQSTNGSASQVHRIRGSSFGSAGSIAASAHSSFNSNGAAEFGAVVASGFDLDHDGRFDVAIGSPDFLGNGTIHVTRADGSWTPLGSHTGHQAGERFGASIDGRSDVNGDGFVDFVVGSPGYGNGSTQAGCARVVSGGKFVNPGSPDPLELYQLTLGFSSTTHNYHFGQAVRAGADLNLDGVPDILVGAPSYAATIFNGTIWRRGLIAAFSGATGTRIGLAFGQINDRLGDAIAGAIHDLDGDGFQDFVVGGSGSDLGGTNSGTVHAYRLFPAFINTYCTGKVNSLGCTPAIGSSGNSSASAATQFLITCSSQINQKVGLLFYAHTPAAGPFQGGFLCVGTPKRRSAPLNSGGSVSGSDCTGTFSYDFNARIQSGADPTLVSGAEVFCQYWSRDPASPSTTGLSNALSFLVNP